MCGISPVEYTEPDDGMSCLCSLIGSVAFVVERISVATFSPFVLIELTASLCLILKLPIDTRIGTEQWKYCMLPSPIIGKIPNLIVESGEQIDDPYFMYTLPETSIAPQKSFLEDYDSWKATFWDAMFSGVNSLLVSGRAKGIPQPSYRPTLPNGFFFIT